MVLKLIILLGVAWCCAGYDHHAISHQSIVQHHQPEFYGHHGELSHIGSHVPVHQGEYAWAYPAYEFSYNVEDHHTNDYKGQHEVRDGNNVKGMYWLIQPDGRKRTVTYYVDKHSGFNAHVEYSDPHHHHPVHPKPYYHAPKTDVYALVNHLPALHDVHSLQNPYYKPHYDPHDYYYKRDYYYHY